jgi:hypothetical protein
VATEMNWPTPFFRRALGGQRISTDAMRSFEVVMAKLIENPYLFPFHDCTDQINSKVACDTTKKKGQI